MINSGHESGYCPRIYKRFLRWRWCLAGFKVITTRRLQRQIFSLTLAPMLWRCLKKMWIKALILISVLAMAGGAVLAYNRAIERAERLEAANQVLQESAQQATKARLKAEKVLLERENTVQVIHKTEVRTVEIIKEVQGECLDVRMPIDLIERLRHRDGGLQDRDSIPTGTVAP